MFIRVDKSLNQRVLFRIFGVPEIYLYCECFILPRAWKNKK